MTISITFSNCLPRSSRFLDNSKRKLNVESSIDGKNKIRFISETCDRFVVLTCRTISPFRHDSFYISNVSWIFFCPADYICCKRLVCYSSSIRSINETNGEVEDSGISINNEFTVFSKIVSLKYSQNFNFEHILIK